MRSASSCAIAEGGRLLGGSSQASRTKVHRRACYRGVFAIWCVSQPTTDDFYRLRLASSPRLDPSIGPALLRISTFVSDCLTKRRTKTAQEACIQRGVASYGAT